MRLWHQKLIPYLPRQQLLGQHRECCALRGAGWGRKHATVDYVFTHPTEWLIVYHYLIMNEMEARGYHPDLIWNDPDYRGKTLGKQEGWANFHVVMDIDSFVQDGEIIYPEHNDEYLAECIRVLKEKNAPIIWESVGDRLGVRAWEV